MPSESDFLRAVLDDPDADGPRLVFADWLEEQGHENRAEFIRLQCAIAGLPESDRDHHPLIGREIELWRAHRDEWTGPLDAVLFPDGTADWFAPVRVVADIAGAVLGFGRSDNVVHQFVHLLAADRWTFRRGFAEKLRASAADYLRAASALERATPLRSLTVNLGEGDSCGALAGCPQLNRLESLRVYAAAGFGADAQPLLTGSRLSALRRLGLHHVHLASHELTAFAESPLAGQLDDLELSITGANVESRRAFLASSCVARLSRLALQEFWSDEHAAAFLAEWPECPRLLELDLAGSAIGDRDLSPILDRSPCLQSLNLSGTQLSDGGLRPIMRSPRLRQLRSLNLSNNAFGDQSILDLVDSPNLVATTQLILRDAGLHPRVREALVTRLGDRVVV